MAVGARVGNFVIVSHGRANKSKRVAANIYVGDCLLDPRHMAGDTLATRASSLVVGVLFDRGYVRAIW